MEIRLMLLNIITVSYHDPKPKAWGFRRSLTGGGGKAHVKKKKKIP